MSKAAFVFDTNVLLSASLIKNSVSARALDKALLTGNVVFSDSTFTELAEVVFRKKFDKYFREDGREEFINQLNTKGVFWDVAETITDCRDPKDNKFLDLAVAAQATCLISGDDDLLVLHPFRGIPILNAIRLLETC